MADSVETEEWLHRKYPDEVSGIGGKMVRRELVKGLRFEEGVSNGEDTLFIYQIACRQIRVVFTPEKWYYHRMHSASATHVADLEGKFCFESSRRIRDSEYQREHTDYALTWEIHMVRQIERSYLVLKNRKDRAGCDELREIAREERKHPLYHCLYLDIRMLFTSCFCCLPLYYLLKWLFSVYSGWKGRGNNDEQSKS